MKTNEVTPGFYRFLQHGELNVRAWNVMVVLVPVFRDSKWLYAYWVRPDGMIASTLITNLDGEWERIPD